MLKAKAQLLSMLTAKNMTAMKAHFSRGTVRVRRKMLADEEPGEEEVLKEGGGGI